MKVVYIGVGTLSPPLACARLTAPQIFNNEAKPAVELTHESDLSSYGRFTRGSIAEFVRPRCVLPHAPRSATDARAPQLTIPS